MRKVFLTVLVQFILLHTGTAQQCSTLVPESKSTHSEINIHIIWLGITATSAPGISGAINITKCQLLLNKLPVVNNQCGSATPHINAAVLACTGFVATNSNLSITSLPRKPDRFKT